MSIQTLQARQSQYGKIAIKSWRFFSFMATLFLLSGNASAQCENQGTINSPACGSSVTQSNVGGKQQWTLGTVNGAHYTVTLGAGSNGSGSYSLSPGSGLSHSFVGTGANVTINVHAGGGCNWVAGGTSAVLTYTRISPTVTAGSNSPVCQGQAINFTSTPAFAHPTTPTFTYAWTGPDSYTSSLQNPARANAQASHAGTYTVTATAGGCSSNGTVNVAITPVRTVAAASSSPTVCVGTTMTNITHATTNVTGAGTATGLPTGVTHSYASNTITISGTPTQTGTFNYTITPTGCGTATAIGTITVTANRTVAAASSSPSVCEGVAIPNITHATTGVTGPGTAIGLPTGVTHSYASNTLTISGTPTQSGTFNYTITPTGCGTATATGTITVNADPTAGAGGALPAICQGGTSAPMNGSVGGGASGGTWSGGAGTWTNANDPANATYTADPSESGVITLTLTASSGSCGTATATKIIMVNLSPTAVAGAPLPDICQGQTSVAMGGSVGGGATDGTWSGGAGTWTNPSSPANATYTADLSESGTITLTLTTTGGSCGTTSVTKDIIVNANPTVSVGGSLPDVCQGTPSSPMGGSIGGGATGSTWSGGAGTWTNANDPANATYTPSISETGLVTLTLTTSGGSCGTTSDTKTVTVNQSPDVNPNADQTLCHGDTTSTININGTYAGTTYDWTNDNTLIGLSATGNGDISSFTSTNTGNVPETASVVVTPFLNGCFGVPDTIQITVNPIPDITANSDLILCNGDNVPTISFTGNVAGTTYNWTNNNPSIGIASTGAGDIAAFIATNSGTVLDSARVIVSTSANGCQGDIDTFAIWVNPSPTVATNVDQAVCNGDTTVTIVFSGSVSGTSFDWNNDNTTIGLTANGNGDITSFTVTNGGTTPDTANIIITPVANGCFGTPDTIQITANPTPGINPNIDQTVCNGINTSAINFSGSVNGTIFSWNNDNTNIGLAANGNGDIPAFAAANTGTVPDSATIIINTSANGCTGAADTIVIWVNPSPVINPNADQSLCNGANSNAISFSSNVTGTTYSWTNDNTNIGLAASGNGDIATFTAINTGNSPDTATIIVIPTAGGCAGIPDTIQIEVNPTSNVSASANQTVCNATSTTAISFSGAVSGASFTWINDNTNIGLAASGNGDIAAFTATNTGNIPDTATIIVSSGIGGCAGTSDTVQIVVNPSPDMVAVSNQTICNADNTTAINFSGSVAGTSFAWTNDNTSIGLAASGNGDIAPFTVTNNGSSVVTATISVTPTANGCNALPQSFTITVNPDNTVSAASVNPTVCQGSTMPTITHTTTGATGIGTPTGLPSGLSASWAGNTITITGTPTSHGVYTYSIPLTGGCANINATGTITVNELPTVNPVADQSICTGGSTTAINFTGSSVAGTTYTWTTDNTAVGMAPGGTGDISSFSVINTGTSPISANITVVPSANGCTGSPETFTITVNPLPQANSPAHQTVCNGSSTQGVTFTANTSGVDYTWTNSNPSIGLAASGNGNIGTFTAINNGTTPITAAITVTPSVNGCTGNPVTFTITVDPTPVVSFTANNNVCAGQAVIFVGNAPAGASYFWDFGDGATSNTLAPEHAYASSSAAYTATLTATLPNGCSAQHSETIQVTATPSAAFSANPATVDINNPTVAFDNQTTNGVNWDWDFGDGNSDNSENPSHTYSSAGQYTVVLVASNQQCSDTATYVINVDDLVDLPNIFSPNGDGVNDSFGLPANISSDVEILILNRWGAPVFETYSASVSWDGKVNGQDASAGVYFYVVRLTKNDGTKQEYKGTVTLVR